MQLPIEQIIELNVKNTLSSEFRGKRINDIFEKIELLKQIIHDYCSIDNQNYSTDDEIINYSINDVRLDLISATSNVLIGHYKASAIILRSALHLAFVSVFFQLKENENNENAYNQDFFNWHNGTIDCPDWSVILPILQNNQNVIQLNTSTNIDIIADANTLFLELNSFTQNRAFNYNNQPILNSNMYKNTELGYEEELFNRFSLLIENTISSILTVWLVTFPEMYNIVPIWCEKNKKNELINSVLNHDSKGVIIQFINICK